MTLAEIARRNHMKLVLHNCYNFGMIDTPQFNLIEKAMDAQVGEVRFEPSVLPKNGQRIKWIIEIEALRVGE